MKDVHGSVYGGSSITIELSDRAGLILGTHIAEEHPLGLCNLLTTLSCVHPADATTGMLRLTMVGEPRLKEAALHAATQILDDMDHGRKIANAHRIEGGVTFTLSVGEMALLATVITGSMRGTLKSGIAQILSDVRNLLYLFDDDTLARLVPPDARAVLRAAIAYDRAVIEEESRTSDGLLN